MKVLGVSLPLTTFQVCLNNKHMSKHHRAENLWIVNENLIHTFQPYWSTVTDSSLISIWEMAIKDKYG